MTTGKSFRFVRACARSGCQVEFRPLFFDGFLGFDGSLGAADPPVPFGTRLCPKGAADDIGSPLS
jgi:hypothetical protein